MKNYDFGFDSIIHIGHEKTGSTALQTAFSVANKDFLKSFGFRYVAPRLPEYPEADSCISAVFSFLSRVDIDIFFPDLTKSFDVQSLQKNSLEVLSDELNTSRGEGLIPIISSELFASRFTSDNITRLSAFCSDHGFERPLIICYLREPIETSVSWLSTRIKLGEWIDGCRLRFASQQDLECILDYEGIIDRWISGFESSMFYIFPYKIVKKDILKHFVFDVIGSASGSATMMDELHEYLRICLSSNPLSSRNKRLDSASAICMNHINYTLSLKMHQFFDLESIGKSLEIRDCLLKLLESYSLIYSGFSSCPPLALDEKDVEFVVSKYPSAFAIYSYLSSGSGGLVSKEICVNKPWLREEFSEKVLTEKVNTEYDDNSTLYCLDRDQIELIEYVKYLSEKHLNLVLPKPLTNDAVRGLTQ
jgi:hypothetical protein